MGGTGLVITTKEVAEYSMTQTISDVCNYHKGLMLHVWHLPGLGDLVLSLKSLTCVCKSHRGGMHEIS